MARDELFWTTERDLGTPLPKSLDQLEEFAHRTIGASVTSSTSERAIATASLHVLGLLYEARGETRRGAAPF